jgi:transposase-like protein/IS1 family transposase
VRKVSAAMPRHKTRHPPPSLRCPHCGAQARHLFYHSTYRTRDGPRRLWRCRLCGKGLSERRGTAFFNLKTAEEEVARSLDAMLRGDTQTSTSHTRRHGRETLRRWRRRAVPCARAVDEEFVTDLSVADLELDEQWSFAGSKKAEFADSAERGEAWWHKAMARETRLLVEQFVSPRTPEAAEMLVNRSFDRLAVGCLPRISSDGYDAYTKPLREQVKAVTVYPLRWALVKKGKPGRPPKPAVIPDPALVYGQVEKTREGKRVAKVEKKLVLGPPSTDLAFVSTSLLERQNGTARSRNRYLVRKTYAFAKLVGYMDDQCEVDKTFYNFCRRHRGLRGETPAMRQGITDHVWSVAEVLGYRSASP